MPATVLDVGCGQGRNALPLARMGFEIVGTDLSKVGIDQMNALAEREALPITGLVADIFVFEDYGAYDFILLDSMFHFRKSEKKQELDLLGKIFHALKARGQLVICMQAAPAKVELLETSAKEHPSLTQIVAERFDYIFEDRDSGHRSVSEYVMRVWQKS